MRTGQKQMPVLHNRVVLRVLVFMAILTFLMTSAYVMSLLTTVNSGFGGPWQRDSTKRGERLKLATEDVVLAVPARNESEETVTGMRRVINGLQDRIAALGSRLEATQPLVLYGCKDPGTVALTFDDGPGKAMPTILDVLKENNVKATFFFIGVHLEPNRDIVLRAFEEGHLIASHTWDHPDMTQLDSDGIISQMKRTEAVLKDITGKTVRFMRPPNGEWSGETHQDLQMLGYRFLAMWNFNTFDWDTDQPQDVVDSVKDTIYNPRGRFNVLMHDRDHTAEAIKEIVPYLVGLGLKLVRLDVCNGIDPSESYLEE